MQSRILYDQMLGRATRLCTDIGKTHFNIYDAVGIYDNLKSYTDMKPVVKQQNYSIDDLYQSLANANDEKKRIFIVINLSQKYNARNNVCQKKRSRNLQN